MTKQKFIQFLEDNNFNVHEESNEIETWTSGGVNMIFTLERLNERKFIEAVENFSVDEEIELHRQGTDYKNAFTIRQSVEDFEEFENKLKTMVSQLK